MRPPELPHAIESRSWCSTRNPQLVVMPSAPSATSSLPAAMKSSTTPPRSRTTRSGVAPPTTRQSIGNGQVAAWPPSPGMRGNRVSSRSIPTLAP